MMRMRWLIPVLMVLLLPLLLAFECRHAPDSDGDGVGNSEDNCPDIANPDQTDCDGDGQGDRCDDPSDCYPGMVLIPAGPFYRGSCNESTSPACQPGEPGYASAAAPDRMGADETPLRTITLDGFYLDSYEVTVMEFEKCVDAGACSSDNYATIEESEYCGFGDYGAAFYPMNCVNWFGADEYCRYVGKRLPTEAEWEKAARGDQGQTYPWGNSAPTCDLANYHDPDGYCIFGTIDIGSYPAGASPYDAYDMAGNVWEWVNDWYDAGYYDPDFGLGEQSPAENPRGPLTGDEKIIRGGGWPDTPDKLRAAKRDAIDPAIGWYDQGFRCAAAATLP